MSISTIKVLDYEGRFGTTSESNSRMMGKIKTSVEVLLPDASLTNLDIYKVNAKRHSFLEETRINKKRVIMAVYGTRNKTSDTLELEAPETIYGIENQFTTFLPPAEEGLVFLSEHGIPLAQWNEKYYSLDILFNLFADDSEEHLKIFDHIMQEFNKLVFIPLTYANSWVHTKNKEALTASFSDALRKAKEQDLENDKRRATQLETEIRTYMRSIKNYSDEAIICRKRVEEGMKGIEALSENLIRDLDLIVAHEKVTDLRIEDGKFIVSTVPLIITSDKGNRYYGGKYRIELDPQRTDVHFFGDNPRQSYWTSRDPHPHVDGENGHACLGNTSGMIAELCSQMQIYALTLICIDFLESANTTDVAGAKVVNWDRVDEDGNVIEAECPIRVELQTCDHCDEDVEELFDVYEGYDNEEDELVDHSFVCADCREEHYHYDEEAEAYLRD